MTFPTLCLTPEHWIGSWVQSTVGCLVVFSFSVAQVLEGLRKQFINNFVYPNWACVDGFNNNNFVLVRLSRFMKGKDVLPTTQFAIWEGSRHL